MLTLVDILVIAAILACAYRGWLVGLEAASVAGLELLACLAVAVLLHEAVAGILHIGLTFVLGDGIAGTWPTLAAFSLLAWGSFALVRTVFHRHTEDEETDIDPLSDRVAGAVAGGVGGVLFVGGVLVTLSMVPFLAGLKPSGDRMLLDVGKTALRAAGQFATERHGDHVLPLWGEPPSRVTDQTALLTSEPWFDADDDGACRENDRFRDVDGNGIFSKDLYFLDVDGDGFRRIGLIDKYVVGRWDAALISDVRPRPDPTKPTKPAAPKPVRKPVPPPPKRTPAPAAPATTKPTEPPPPQPESRKRPDDDF